MSGLTKPGRSLFQLRQEPFSIGSFIKNVCNDKYVLVIGSEVLLDKDQFPESNGDIQTQILKVLNEGLGQNFSSLTELVAIRPAVSSENNPNGADLLRNLLVHESQRDAYFSMDELSPELITLLRTRLFRFVMTTTVDGCVEDVMRDIWQDELRVANIADQDDWKRFQIEIAETMDSGDYSRTHFRYDTPTLIYIFGKATSSLEDNFLKTENDAIEFIERWMKRDEPVIEMIKDRRVLALGCKFEDWYFRFFWYILKRDFDRIGEGEVALSLDDAVPDDNNLHRYLERKQIRVHKDARAFMQSICNVLSPESHSPDSENFHQLIKSKRGAGEIFLSYCSADFVLASKIFFRLTELGYNVGFDSENLCGGDYEADIRKAINGCRHIIPLAVDGYNLRASYHTVYEDIIGGRIDGVDLMTDDFSSLKKMIDHLKTR